LATPLRIRTDAIIAWFPLSPLLKYRRCGLAAPPRTNHSGTFSCEDVSQGGIQDVLTGWPWII